MMDTTKYTGDSTDCKMDNTDCITDGINYLSDEELLTFISNIEEHDLVMAPPDMADNVLCRIDKKDKKIEYKKFRNRVIVSVAAILVITAWAPDISALMENGVSKIVIKSYEDDSLYDGPDEVIKEPFIGLGNSYNISNLFSK